MKKLLQFGVLISIVIVFSNSGFAQNDPIIGKWKTIDDETNEPKSIVEIYKKGDKYFGKIDTLFRKPNEDPDPVCDKCPEDDPRYNQPILGMEIIKNMEKDGDEYSGGKILDPKKGEIYRCKMWLEEGKLKVRGYLYFLYRTQTWHRVE